jgi:hypothetical protein
MGVFLLLCDFLLSPPCLFHQQGRGIDGCNQNLTNINSNNTKRLDVENFSIAIPIVVSQGPFQSKQPA